MVASIRRTRSSLSARVRGAGKNSMVSGSRSVRRNGARSLSCQRRSARSAVRGPEARETSAIRRRPGLGPSVVRFARGRPLDGGDEDDRLRELVAGDRRTGMLDDLLGVTVAPSLTATMATTSWPQRSLCRPATTTSTTAGCPAIAPSTSSAKIFSPPELMVTESRPSSSIWPSGRSRPGHRGSSSASRRSPGTSQPSSPGRSGSRGGYARPGQAIRCRDGRVRGCGAASRRRPACRARA